MSKINKVPPPNTKGLRVRLFGFRALQGIETRVYVSADYLDADRNVIETALPEMFRKHCHRSTISAVYRQARWASNIQTFFKKNNVDMEFLELEIGNVMPFLYITRQLHEFDEGLYKRSYDMLSAWTLPKQIDVKLVDRKEITKAEIVEDFNKQTKANINTYNLIPDSVEYGKILLERYNKT
jgi:hypothetical protein